MNIPCLRNSIVGMGVVATFPFMSSAQVAEELIVRMMPGSPAEPILSALNLPLLGTAAPGLVLTNLADAPDGEWLPAILEQTDHVAWVEYNDPIGVPVPAGETQSFFVNASQVDYRGQYVRRLIGVDSGGAPGTTRIKVAVLDTGVDRSHPDLAAQTPRTWASFIADGVGPWDQGDGIDNDGDGDIDEMVGHGTAVAGGIVMVAPHVEILPVKVLNSDGFGTSFSIAQGIRYAINQQADIINLSLTSTTSSLAIENAITDAVAAGIIVVACAGNSGDEIAKYPAAYPSVWAVAGTDPDDRPSEFSNFGTHIAFSAPAEGIVSTLPDGQYGLIDGTSLAAALVSGLAARVLGAEPNTTPADLFDLISSATVGIVNDNGLYGSGRISARRLPGSPEDCAERNGDGLIDVFDLIGFLQAWFEGAPDANLTGFDDVDVINSSDLLEYLQCWFYASKTI